MGGHWQLEMQERGYGPAGDKYVCDDCLPERGVAAFILANAVENECDYCHRTAASPFAAPIDDVIGHIVDGIESEWEDPNGSMAWDGREGGWQGDYTDSYDLLTSGELDISIEIEELFDDILSTILDRQWCQIDPYSLSPSESLIWGWKAFADTVKHGTRYLFMHTVDEGEAERDEISPADMLDALAGVIANVGILTTLPARTNLFRVRVGTCGNRWTTAADLGPPPLDKATVANRMSPAGIPMFYGALDENTACLEVWDASSTQHMTASVGRFSLAQDTIVLDLTSLPDVPSLFDVDHRHLRAGIIFLRYFVTELSKPIVKDGREHIEYVPTQIVTEYFRRVYPAKHGIDVKGIIYPSSRSSGGKSCVVFATAADIASAHDPQAITADKLLLFDEHATTFNNLP